MAKFVILTSYDRPNLVDFKKVNRVEAGGHDAQSANEFIFWLEGPAFHYKLPRPVIILDFFKTVQEIAAEPSAEEDQNTVISEEEFLLHLERNTKLREIHEKAEAAEEV